jgi:hypothetical protein
LSSSRCFRLRRQQCQLDLQVRRHREGNRLDVREQRLIVVVSADPQARGQELDLVLAPAPQPHQVNLAGCDQSRAVCHRRPRSRSDQTEPHASKVPGGGLTVSRRRTVERTVELDLLTTFGVQALRGVVLVDGDNAATREAAAGPCRGSPPR